MEITYLIVLAIVFQLVTLKMYRLIGALIGGFITTVVLFYGMYLYSESDSITLMGKYELSMSYFFLFIFVWYTLDVLKAGWEVYKKFGNNSMEASNP